MLNCSKHVECSDRQQLSLCSVYMTVTSIEERRKGTREVPEVPGMLLELGNDANLLKCAEAQDRWHVRKGLVHDYRNSNCSRTPDNCAAPSTCKSTGMHVTV